MTIEKLPSGSYRIRKMYKGQMYTVTFDGKPTQKEAMLAMAKELEKVQEKHVSMTFEIASGEYIESKRNVISPSTIRGYKGYIGSLSKAFLDKNVHAAQNLKSPLCWPATACAGRRYAPYSRRT